MGSLEVLPNCLTLPFSGSFQAKWPTHEDHQHLLRGLDEKFRPRNSCSRAFWICPPKCISIAASFIHCNLENMCPPFFPGKLWQAPTYWKTLSTQTLASGEAETVNHWGKWLAISFWIVLEGLALSTVTSN